jgi:outer membrane cobalamin receptor
MRTRLLASTLLACAIPFGAVSLLALAPSAALAQDYTSGNLSGRVETDAGAPVGSATVTVRSSQGAVRTAVTDAQGRFLITALAAGAYRADITASDLPALTNQAVSVSPGGSSFTFTLAGSTGAVSELVVTGSSRKTQDFSRTDTGLAVDVQKLAERIPVGRSIANVALLTPGVSQADPSINTGARRTQSTVVIGGTSAAESVYYINGLNVTDLRNLLGYSDLPFDAISSIEIKTGGYQAEFGRATGGVVNIVTRSGTNEWHGGVSVAYAPEALRSHAPQAASPGGIAVAGANTYNQVTRLDTVDASVFLSGPIL